MRQTRMLTCDFVWCVRGRWESAAFDLLIESPKSLLYLYAQAGILLAKFGGHFCMMWMLHHAKQVMVD